jgi:hypothetical protein
MARPGLAVLPHPLNGRHADQNCQLIDGRQGHRSGAVGSEPAVTMPIQVADLEGAVESN